MKKILLSLALVSMVGVSQAQSWVTKTTGAPALHFVNALKAVNTSTIWFSDTASASATDTGRYIGLSTDGGNTWANKLISGPVAAATIGDMHPISATTAWLVSSGSGAQNGIWKTTNAGTSWTKQTTAPFSTAISFANVVHFWDENVGFCAGDPFGTGANLRFEMYTTTNGGTTWTNLPTGTAPAPLNGAEFGYTGKITVLGDNIWYGTDLGRVLYSPNKGASWQAFQTPAVDFGGVTVSGFTADVAFRDTSNGLLISDEDGVSLLYSTTNSGSTWSAPMTPVGPFYSNNIEYVPGTPNTYVSSGFDAGSSISNDGGLTWREIGSDPVTPGKYYGSLEFLSPTVGFAGGVSQAQVGGVAVPAFSVLSGNVLLAVSESDANKLKLSVFPNPASDVLNLKSDKEITGVTVIDLSGKIIKREKGASQINVSNLAKGTYVVQAAYKNGSVENTKFIKK
ncbi:T9SS type A sorting domain-containing protein [Epilithonimonas sp. JDS]|uniref:T9SS type A sorting domain-containing protein n=1 Tax=Epilithonimonas sp. JDS TaxID=2902797 RepID=UPI001E319C0A|nr:T9SS type A sorting domain-containing protein [Epilithonimonas sp. JDS]MCD9854148.1 T9SS type A sorting domain-containing protein [Epilithonimonas sp. JDS]